MQVALIAPTKLLDLTEKGDLHFVLAQRALSDTTYERFYAKSHLYKILDNGAYEQGKSINWDDVLEVAASINADEVILPDNPKDPVESYKMTKEALSVVDHDFRWMAVPHGRNFQEYLKYFKMCTKLEVYSIGFSILDLWKFNWRIRPMVINRLAQEPEWFNQQEKHLLGLDCILELHSYFDINIRSVDTSMPFTYAYHRRKLTLDWHEPKLERIPDDAEPNRLLRLLANYNIKTLLRVAHAC